jgi:hypothetical protein
MSATQCFGQDALADVSSCADNTNVHEVVFSILPIFQELEADSGSSKVGSYDKNYAKIDRDYRFLVLPAMVGRSLAAALPP